jgi:hypothetical protein
MKTVWQGRMVQVAGKYGEHAPMAAACCNACRTCATTNIASLALAAVGGSAVVVWSGTKRLLRRR